jgi:hypothetical protein
VYLGDTRNGFGMLIDTGRYADGNGWTPLKQRRESLERDKENNASKKKKKTSEPSVNWSDFLQQHRANALETLWLAGMLGVHPDSLRCLELGYVPETEDEPEHWLFPERDDKGIVIGLMRRYLNGKKKRMAGARSGLSFDPSQTTSDVLLIVEGHSDVAAAFTMGLYAVGRPNNLGGAELLSPLIVKKQETRDVLVVVLGENDKKENGLWPGREGALRVAEQLSRLLRQRIAWTMPPDNVKDLRKWLSVASPNVLNKKECHAIGKHILQSVRERLEWVEPPGNLEISRNDEREQTSTDISSCPLNHVYIDNSISTNFAVSLKSDD